MLDPRRQTLEIVFNSTGIGLGNTECNQPDNIAVSPRGGIVLCEDGSTSVIAEAARPHPGRRHVRLRGQQHQPDRGRHPRGPTRALNAHRDIVKRIAPGNYTGHEWAGACFYEKWLFVNIQTPGITFAITGPWDNGAL